MRSLAKPIVALMAVAAITCIPSLKAESEFSSATIGIGVVVSDPDGTIVELIGPLE